LECAVSAPRACFLIYARCGSLRPTGKSPPQAAKEDTGGEAQPIKQSFEADRLEQLPIIFFFLPPYCFYLDSPPPCVFFSPPARGMSLLGDRADVNCVRDSCASPLHNHEFLPLQPRPTVLGTGLDRPLSGGFSTARPPKSGPKRIPFYFSKLSKSLHVESASSDAPVLGARGRASARRVRPFRRAAVRRQPDPVIPCRCAALCV
jgi:hypothetical protein